ncbi:neurofilament triplet m protein-like protein [Anaeramoeba flamelloides]|uniref:Neurofilament triplet m protein-like protein n=1 Tax=Anaeramoeba flamelloides TaxID=1746091 RepID=A0ABQ8XGG5_9EUKA|nr:neurofilament triplet m protein-like protein [Anaeramoeba flamelloides]
MNSHYSSNRKRKQQDYSSFNSNNNNNNNNNKRKRKGKDESYTNNEKPIDPIVNRKSKVLILGTYLSNESLEHNFYYGESRNAFWKILAEIFKVNLRVHKDRDDLNDARKKLALNNGIAIWTVLNGTKNPRTSINRQMTNNLSVFLKKYPNIKYILFTSKSSSKIFKKKFKKIKLQQYILPSPSSAFNEMSHPEKRTKYLEIFQTVGLAEKPEEKEKEEGKGKGKGNKSKKKKKGKNKENENEKEENEENEKEEKKKTKKSKKKKKKGKNKAIKEKEENENDEKDEAEGKNKKKKKKTKKKKH